MGNKAQIRKQLVLDFQGTFATDEGQRALEYLSFICLEGKPTFDPNSQRMSDFREGMRAVILEIREKLDADPNKD